MALAMGEARDLPTGLCAMSPFGNAVALAMGEVRVLPINSRTICHFGDAVALALGQVLVLPTDLWSGGLLDSAVA